MLTAVLALILNLSFASTAPSGVTQLPTWTHVSDSDLSTFGRAVGDAPLVGLGESVHATEGFSQAKFRLIRYLVEQKGFRAVAFESPWRAAQVAAEFINGRQITLQQAIAGVFSVWNSQSVAELFLWLRQFNGSHPDDPVRFFGFDIQGPKIVDVNDLKLFLGDRFPEALSVCGSTSIKAGLVFAGTEVADADHQLCLTALDRVDQFLSNLPDSDEVTRAKISAIAIRSFENQLYYWTRDRVRSDDARDQGMAKVFVSLRSLGHKEPKTVLWAHNIHLTANSMELGGPMFKGVSSMGSHLFRQFNSMYAPFALTGHYVSANWPGTPVQDLPLPSDVSIEAILRQNVKENAFIDLKEVPFSSGKLIDLGWNQMEPARQFRGLFYMTKVPAMIHPQ